MHIIGKIDIEIYRCVTADIQTSDVIITQQQIEHIQERHPNDYERYFKYVNEILESPDYILEANKPNKVDDKRYNRYLRTKKILYKNE